VIGGTVALKLGAASGFPVTDPLDSKLLVGASGDIFVAELNAEDFSIVYSTVIGGPGIDSPRGGTTDGGALLVVGYTDGRLPVVRPAQPERAGGVSEFGDVTGFDGFVLKLRLAQRLSVVRSGSELVFSWPVSTPELVLEATSSVGPGAVWERVTAVPVITNQQQTVTLRAEDGARFFRLREL
jgi:hypothetical protein